MILTEKVNYRTHRAIVYGPPKSGKTLLVGKLSERYKLIWVDVEKGWSTLLQLPKVWQCNIDIISLPDSAVFPIAAETLPKIVKGPVDICSEHGKVSCSLCKKSNAQVDSLNVNTLGYNTIIVFDSLTQLTNSMISHITKGMPDDYKLQLDDWGQLKFLLHKFLSQIQTAGYNVICITHEEVVTFDDGSVRIVPSSGSAKSSVNTAKYFDHVIYCHVRNGKYKAASGGAYAAGILTGSRLDIAIEKKAEPTLLDIFDNWNLEEPNQLDVKSSSNLVYETLTPEEQAKKDQFAQRALLFEEQKKQQLAAKVAALVEGKAGAKSPGQIALDNIKAKQEELKKQQT